MNDGNDEVPVDLPPASWANTRRARGRRCVMTGTIRVRIAVAVCPNGTWNSEGCKLLVEWRGDDDADTVKTVSRYIFEKHGIGHVVWLEADVPLPELPTIEAEVASLRSVSLHDIRTLYRDGR